MNPEAQRDLQLLDACARDARVSQRRMASRLGIALGLTNLYVKRLARKGYIKCVNVRSNRVLYLITPKGIAAKARLTYEFVQHSLKLYAQARSHLRSTIASKVEQSHRRFVIYGTSEAAELAYISLRELGIEPIAVVSDQPNGPFLGIVVHPIANHATLDYDVIIVATLDKAAPFVARLLAAGVAPEKICTLRPEETPVRPKHRPGAS